MGMIRKGSRMTIRHLKIFLMVYQTQNITRAAENLHMTQPAVTRAVKEIEQYYGVCLFERLNRRILTTELGEQFYAQALHIVDSFEKLEEGLRSWNDQGILRVGASVSIGNFLLPKAVKIYQNAHPKLKIYATVSNGARLQQMLLDNQLDFALIEGEVVDDRLKKEPFAKDRLVLILPPDDPLAGRRQVRLSDISDRPFLLRENGSAGRNFLNHVFAVRELPLEPVWESTSTQAIVKAVHEGLGISFLPGRLVKNDIDAGFVISMPVADESFERTNYIVWHQNKYLTDAAKELMELCRRSAY